MMLSCLLSRANTILFRQSSKGVCGTHGTNRSVQGYLLSSSVPAAVIRPFEGLEWLGILCRVGWVGGGEDPT